MSFSIDDIDKPVRYLREPETNTDWENVRRVAKSQIKETPSGAQVDMSAILKHLADNFDLAVTRITVRNSLFGVEDYRWCLRTFIPLTTMRWVKYDVIERLRNGEGNFTSEKYRDLYKEQESKEEFDFCLDMLFTEACLAARHA